MLRLHRIAGLAPISHVALPKPLVRGVREAPRRHPNRIFPRGCRPREGPRGMAARACHLPFITEDVRNLPRTLMTLDGLESHAIVLPTAHLSPLCSLHKTLACFSGMITSFMDSHGVPASLRRCGMAATPSTPRGVSLRQPFRPRRFSAEGPRRGGIQSQNRALTRARLRSRLGPGGRAAHLVYSMCKCFSRSRPVIDRKV